MNGFVMPKRARITRVIVNGVETEINPPIDLEAGDVISFPYEEVRPVVCNCTLHPSGATKHAADCPAARADRKEA